MERTGFPALSWDYGRHRAAAAYSFREECGATQGPGQDPPVTARSTARWNGGERSLAVLAKDYGIIAQRVGQVIAAKDGEVYAAWRTGKYTLADLAEAYGLTSEDVTRIVVDRHPEQEDEKTGRAVMRSRLELLSLAVQEVIENPGWKVTAVGRVAEDPDGNPLVDVASEDRGPESPAQRLQESRRPER